MTVVVGVAAPDGLVLAADSRTTSFPQGPGPDRRHRIISDTADKVFTVCDRFAVATYGEAFVRSKTINGLMDEFIAGLDSVPTDVGRFAKDLGEFFHDRYTEAISADDEAGPELLEPGSLGFLVGGYDEDGIGHLSDVLIPGPEFGKVTIDTASGGFVSRGQTDVITRLLAGVDWEALQSQITSLPRALLATLDGLEYDIQFPITVQDAVDFAAFLIRTTIDMQRFSDGIRASTGGAPVCGGETRVAVVRRSGIEWVCRPPVSSARRPGRAEEALS